VCILVTKSNCLSVVRKKVFMKKTDPEAIDTSLRSPAEEQKVKKEITELSKMTDSGTAAIILRDLRKKRSESPTLDPRNASRTPSAAIEPSRKPRYATPYFACMTDCVLLYNVVRISAHFSETAFCQYFTNKYMFNCAEQFHILE